MTDDEFRSCIRRLFGRYNRKPPEDGDVLQDAWAAVSHIPSEAVGWIMQRLLDGERLPTNWVREFRSLWDQWLTNNPGRRANEPKRKTGCEFCDNGELYMAFQRNGLWYDGCAPCGHCNPTLASSVTIHAAQHRGYVVIQPYRDDNGQPFGQAIATRAWVIEQNRGRVTVPGSRRAA